MKSPERQQSSHGKTMRKQLTGKREDTPLHTAARAGNLELVVEIISNIEEAELKQLLSKQNNSGETALYVAAEHSYVDLVKEMIKYYDVSLAGTKAKNGYDAFHIAAKQGDLEILKVLLDAFPELSMTVDPSNTTALHTAAAQGHTQVVKFLLEEGSSLLTIAKSNGKTALHSAARHGHLEVLRALLSNESGITTRIDKKGQTALHMAVKGMNFDLVDELVKSDPSLLSMTDNKGNTALHIATRKGRAQIVHKLLDHEEVEFKMAINKSGETALDTAEKTGHSEVAAILRERGIQSAKSIKPPTATAKELKQTVSDIKHGVHNQLEHTIQTRKRVRGIAKRLNKMHSEGLNNAINSTTVVAVLIATVAFAAIFNVPGQYADSQQQKLQPEFSSGQAEIAFTTEFLVFIIFDAIALFISLAVVVVQTSVVVIERGAKKQMMAVINKLMWLACVMVSVAFLALSYIVVGKENRWYAIGITCVGTVIMVATLGTMCYWVIMHRIEGSKLRRRSSTMSTTRSRSWSISTRISDSEIQPNEYKTVYAI